LSRYTTDKFLDEDGPDKGFSLEYHFSESKKTCSPQEMWMGTLGKDVIPFKGGEWGG